MAKLMNTRAQETYLKALVTGRSGAGKTHLCVTAPDPLILLAERQGYLTVQYAAQLLGIPMPPCIWIESANDMRTVLAVLRANDVDPIPHVLRRVLLHGESTDEERKEVEDYVAALPYRVPKTVALDGTSKMLELIGEEIDQTAGTKIGKDGLPVKADRYWGVLVDRCERMIDAFRDLPYHVLFTALLDDRTVGEGDEQSRVITPSTPTRKLPDKIQAAVNTSGVLTVREKPRRDDEGNVVYDRFRRVRFANPDWIMSKEIPQIGPYSEPDFGLWVFQVTGEAPSNRQLPEPPTDEDAAPEPVASEPEEPAAAAEPSPGDGAANGDASSNDAKPKGGGRRRRRRRRKDDDEGAKNEEEQGDGANV